MRFIGTLEEHVQKRLGANLAGPVEIGVGGEGKDQRKGIASALALAVVPLYQESYQATEFIFGRIPLRVPGLSALFFQIPVLNVKGRSVPGAGHFAAHVPVPIASTIVTPKAGLGPKFVALRAIGDDGLAAGRAYRERARWTPLLEALNASEAASRAAWPKARDANFGNFYVRADTKSPLGLTQMAPYKGEMVITRQAAPARGAGVNKAVFDWDEVVSHFLVLGNFVAKRPKVGEFVGPQVVVPSNAAMMSMVLGDVDAKVPAPGASIPTAREAPPAAGDGAGPFETVPCPTCAMPVGVRVDKCPACKQDLVWD